MKTTFIRVAERAMEAGTAALGVGIHEKAGFLAYHAFESTGSALGAHFGLEMGKSVGHANKIKRFQHAAKNVRLDLQVALLAVQLTPLRNLLLYPNKLPDGTIESPENQITSAKAEVLLKRVGNMVKTVKKKL